MSQRIFIPLFLLIPAALSAQHCGFSEGKNLTQLRSTIFAKAATNHFVPHYLGHKHLVPPEQLFSFPSAILLPKWSAEELPFFCKIEHDWGKNSRLPLKFRLGSVAYVDWLEGK